MESPYLPPATSAPEDRDLARKRRFWKRMIWVSVFGLLLFPAIGAAGTVMGMIRAFTQLAETGTADPEKLAGSISSSLLATLYGLLFCIPGVVVMILSIVRFRACAPATIRDGAHRSKPPVTSP